MLTCSTKRERLKKDEEAPAGHEPVSAKQDKSDETRPWGFRGGRVNLFSFPGSSFLFVCLQVYFTVRYDFRAELDALGNVSVRPASQHDAWCLSAMIGCGI